MSHERVVLSIKATGPDPAVHVPVEVAWWDLATGQRGVFVPAHNAQQALGGCDLDTIESIGYLKRLARAEQDQYGREMARFTQVLHESVLISTAPLVDIQLVHKLVNHYLADFPYSIPGIIRPQWCEVLDLGSYAAGILGLGGVPDLPRVCEVLGVPLEHARTADTDVEAIGRCVQRLAELAERTGQDWRPMTHPPSLAELAERLRLAVDGATYDLVTFHNHGTGDEQTYTVDSKEISTLATDIFGPAFAVLSADNARFHQQLHETAVAATNAGTAWRQEIDDLTAQLQQLQLTRGGKLDDPELRRLCGLVRARQPEEPMPLSDPEWADYAAAANAVVTALLQRIADVDRLTEAQQAQAEELRAAQEHREHCVGVLAETTPWGDLVVPDQARLADFVSDGMFPAEVAPEFTLGPAPTSRQERWYEGYEHGPLPICPAPFDCGHPRMAHDVEDNVDPIPMCCTEGCRCGGPPAGWSRMPGQRVWQENMTIPGGVYVLARDGAVYPVGVNGAWINEGLGPVVEVEAVNPPPPGSGEVYPLPETVAEVDG